MSLVTVSELARKIGAKPRDISTLFYARQLDDAVCPIVGGRRLIPEDYIETIRWALQHAGKQVDGAKAEGA